MSRGGVGRILKALREARGLTQTDLARKAKVTQAYIALLEAGRKKNPSLATLRRIAKALGVPMMALVRGGRRLKMVYLDHTLLSGPAKRDLGPVELAALRRIRKWYKAGRLDLRISKVHKRELDRYRDTKMSAAIEQLFSDFSQVAFVEDHELLGFHSQWTRQGGITHPLIEDDPTSSALRRIGLTRDDAHHLMLAIRGKCDVFLTTDWRTILRHRESVEKQFPAIRLMPPSALVKELTRGK